MFIPLKMVLRGIDPDPYPYMGVSENVVYPEKPNDFADHEIPMKNGHFIGNRPNIFRQTHIFASRLDDLDVYIRWMGQRNPNHQLIGGENPMILFGLKNHPAGDAGFRNHPQYVSIHSDQIYTEKKTCPYFKVQMLLMSITMVIRNNRPTVGLRGPYKHPEIVRLVHCTKLAIWGCKCFPRVN